MTKSYHPRLAISRRMISYIVLAALVAGQVVGLIALPSPVKAEVSADPNGEIIYVDNNGFIRVFDTQGDPLVKWVSPDGSWDQIVLLDANNDGDQEILALDTLDNLNMRVAVFDPVVAFGASDPNKVINGIPWDTLYVGLIAGEGQYIVAGNFDPGINGDEFAVGSTRGNTSVVQIWKAAGLDSKGNPTGKAWTLHLEKEYPELEYTYGTAGNLDNVGADELVLFDPESAESEMDVYRPDQDMLLTDSYNSSHDKFNYGVAGQLIKDGQEELVAILSVDRPDKESLRTYIMNDRGEIKEDEKWAFTPQPEWVFLADIRGNGDKEPVFLRNYPDDKEGPRLIIRDDWGDDARQNNGLIEWALMDDGSKNEFRAGAGGDIDGDGKDEIVLLRNDRLRIFDRPENGSEDDSNRTDYMLATDNDRINLLIGDLDRLGFTQGPVLMVSKSSIDESVSAGTISNKIFVDVSNVGAPDNNLFTTVSVPPSDTWVDINPTFAQPPFTFSVTFDATNLKPGEYTSILTIHSNQTNVINNDITLSLHLTVVPPTLNPQPLYVALFQLPCKVQTCTGDTVTPITHTITTTVRINGGTNLAFRAAIVGVPKADGTSAAAVNLPGAITGGKIDENGNMVIYDQVGNSRTLGEAQVASTSATTPTVIVDPALTWVTSAKLNSNIVPATLTFTVDPSILTKRIQHEYAALVLVADTRAGTPETNVFIVPIDLANIGGMTWIADVSK